MHAEYSRNDNIKHIKTLSFGLREHNLFFLLTICGFQLVKPVVVLRTQESDQVQVKRLMSDYKVVMLFFEI